MSVDLSVVCPAYDEEDCIADSIRTLSEALAGSGRTWQLVVVDDGSSDDTLARARAARRPGVEVLTHRPNRGRGFALRRGIEAAIGRLVVTTEADLTWGTESVLALARTLDELGCDVSVASPWLPGGAMRGVPPHRVLLSRVGNLALSYRFGVRMSTGMTRGYRRQALEQMRLTRDDKDLHLEILAEAQRLGLSVREVPATLRWPDERRTRPSSLRARHVVHHLAWAFGLE